MLVKVAELFIIMKEMSWDMSKDGEELTKEEQENLNKKLVDAISYTKKDPQSQVTLAKKFINAGADVNYIDESGHSMLSIAIIANRNDLVTLLLDNNADFTVLNQATGKSMLDLAITTRHEEIVNTLIDHGHPITQDDVDLANSVEFDNKTGTNFKFSDNTHKKLKSHLVFKFGSSDSEESLSPPSTPKPKTQNPKIKEEDTKVKPTGWSLRKK